MRDDAEGPDRATEYVVTHNAEEKARYASEELAIQHIANALDGWFPHDLIREVTRGGASLDGWNIEGHQ